MKYTIATIHGDGIGPDVVREAVRALKAVARCSGFELDFVEAPMGGAAYDAFGCPLPDSSLATCHSSDAILLGAVGGPRWDKLPGDLRPEAGLLGLRAGMGTYANLRPARIFPELASACPLKPDIVSGGLDLLIVRELTGGIYFGERGRSPDGGTAWDTERYTKAEIERLLEVAYGAARARSKKLCVVDKANVLESSRLWRQTAQELAARYPDVETSFMYVDNCAMQLVRNPRQFDVIATSNMFGDILSDEASMITGSIGMLPSASVGSSGPGIFEPIHGSAPDLAGKDQANPLAAILSGAMLLAYGLKREAEAAAIERAVSSVLAAGYRCADIATGAEGEIVLGTSAMGETVARAIEEAAQGTPRSAADAGR